MTRKILIESKEQGLWVRLNRPEKRNALDGEMLRELAEALRLAQSSENVHYVVLTGAGSHFCAGADLEWLRGQPDTTVLRDLYQALWECDAPLVGVVQGAVRGGGVGLTAGCDLVLAQTQSTFALPELRLGLVPGVLTPLLIHKIGVSGFLEMSLTGGELSALQAQALRLIHFTETSDRLAGRLDSLLSTLAQADPRAAREMKRSVRVHRDPSPASFSALAESTAGRLASGETRNRISAFLEQR